MVATAQDQPPAQAPHRPAAAFLRAQLQQDVNSIDTITGASLSGWELPDHVMYDILKLSGGMGTHRAAAACRIASILLRRYPELRHVKAPLDFESVQEAVDIEFQPVPPS